MSFYRIKDGDEVRMDQLIAGPPPPSARCERLAVVLHPGLGHLL